MNDYIIDLKLEACADCGYLCCQAHFKQCAKPIFTGAFCNRNKFEDEFGRSICKEYPLLFDGNEFQVLHCLGYEHLPKELFDLRDQLNELMPEQFDYNSNGIRLSLSKIKPKQIKAFFNPDSDLIKIMMSKNGLCDEMKSAVIEIKNIIEDGITELKRDLRAAVLDRENPIVKRIIY
ncbi:MAG: hypothetical protein WC307_04790 [Candidatus Nanoarchaeia archaeon]|jgi:hypothetical protein